MLTSFPYNKNEKSLPFPTQAEKNAIFFRLPCKRQSSVKCRAWLQRFDDVTGVEKSCVAKAKKRKKMKEKCIIAT